jgi:hypothetical protein
MQFTNEAYTLKKNIGEVSTSGPDTKSVEKKIPEESPEQKIKEEKLCTECESIYQSGLINIKQKRLTTPLNDNAYEKYISLKLLDQNLAIDLLKKITACYESLLLNSIRANKISNAKHFLERIKSISPDTDTRLFEEKISKKDQIIQSKIAEKQKKELNQNSENSDNYKSTQKNKNGTSTSTVSRDWIEGICVAVYSTYGDTGKVNIIVSSLRQVKSLTGEDAYTIYNCSDLYGDSGKLLAIRSLSSKLQEKGLSSDHFSSIIKDLYSDSSKTKGASMLVPFVKSK